MATIHYYFKYNPGIVEGGKKALQAGLVKMMTDAQNLAKQNAPVLTGALINSSRLSTDGPLTMTLTFGSAAVPYAAIRERENRKHPGTTRYVQRAGQTIQAKAASYFQKLV